MNILYISAVLLLFEINSISGYKISHKIQASSHETAAHRRNNTELYEILEDDSKTVKIVYPKAEKPTLREIVYYHVIETPYGEDTDTEPESVDVSTERPFTNSHGFQFITEDPEENDSIEKNSSSDSEVSNDDDLLEVDDDNDDSSSSLEETDEDTDEDEIILTTRKPMTSKADEIKTTPTTTVASNIEVTTMKNEEEAVTETVELPAKVEVTTNKVDKMEQKKLTRSVLFNQARNKYQNIRKKPTLRRRRSTNMKKIPEAPKLAPINLDGLPEYVKKLINIPKSKTLHTSNTKAKSHFDEDEFKEELHHKIEDMISSLKPDIDSVEHLNDEEPEMKRVPRTFGMNLTMGGGHVWNELWSKPGVSFDVGDIESTESKEEAKPIEELSETPDITGEHVFSFIPNPTEQKPLFINNIVSSEESDKDSGEITKESEETEPEELAEGNSEANSEGADDIYVNVNKPKAVELLSEEIFDESKSKEEIKTNKLKTNKDSVKTEKAREFDESATDESNKAKHDKKQHTDKKELAENPELLQQLMENEQFWKWLSSWTETYMELLIQHVKRMVHDEVSRQIKKLKKEIIEDQQKSNTKEKEQMSPEKDKNESTTEGDAKKNNSENIGTEDKGTQTEEPTVKDGKLIIDGKEIPLTHKSNFDKEGYEALSKLKHKKDKHKNKESVADEKVTEPFKEKPITPLNEVNETEHRKDKTPLDVTATNIFGNAVGTDKVTNIFIFYPKGSDIANDLKPFVNDSSNVFGLSATEAGVTIDERFPEKITAEKELDDKQVDTESKIEETNNIIKPLEDKEANISTTSVASENEGTSEVIPDKEEKNEDEKKVEEGKIETDTNDVKEDKPTTEQKEDSLTTEKPKEVEKISASEGDKQELASKEESEAAKFEENKESEKSKEAEE